MNTIGKLQHSIASPRVAPASVHPARRVLAAAAPPKVDEVKTKAVESVDPHKDAEQGPGGLGDLLGPIGLTYSAGIKVRDGFFVSHTHDMLHALLKHAQIGCNRHNERPRPR